MESEGASIGPVDDTSMLAGVCLLRSVNGLRPLADGSSASVAGTTLLKEMGFASVRGTTDGNQQSPSAAAINLRVGVATSQ